MEKKVAIVTFEKPAQAYEAYSKIKRLTGLDQFKLKQLAVIEKDQDDRQFTVKDQVDIEGPRRLFRDSFIGMLIGILGGPLGIFFGWIAGDLVGMGHNYVSGKETKTVFDEISERIKSGETGLLIHFEEGDEDVLNRVVKTQLAGTIIRFDYDQVKEDAKRIQSHDVD